MERSNPTLLPKSECREQPVEEEYQKELPLSGDKTTAKSLSLKRQAEESKVPHKRSRTSAATDTNKRLETFACPFYRKDPERYLDCINLKLNRISDVKQHLKRRHTWNYSCSRCFKGFSSSKAYEDHVLQQACAITDRTNNDGVSPAAQESLRYRVDRSSSSELQWHEICRILFGKLGDSLNPHHDGVFKEITGIIRGIWKNEEQSIISSLKETRNIPCADQLRPLLSEILSRVEDCFEQKEQKSSKDRPHERSESTQDAPGKSSEEGKPEHYCEPSLGVSSIKSNNGPLEISEPNSLPMRDWSFSAGFDISSNILNYPMLPEYQNQQAEYPYVDLSAGLLHHDDQRYWHSIGPNSTIAVGNIMSHQASIDDCTFTEDDLLSAQMPKTSD
jgi:hypothetical protein